MDDIELLRDYVQNGSEEAFARIVGQYVNLVYSAALRQVRDRQTAEDVVQVVFLILAKKARRLRARPSLSGWLLSVTHFASREAIRAESRRKRHTQRLAQMSPTGPQKTSSSTDTQRDWELVGPHLDAAMAHLAEASRTAVVLRYFENRSYREVAERLRISEPAARQRVSRALEQLRAYFARCGVVASAEGLGALLAAHAIHGAPSSLGSAAASYAAKGAAVSARHAAMAKGAMIGMVPVWAKAAVVSIVVIAIAGTSATVYRLTTHSAVASSMVAHSIQSASDSKSIRGIVRGPDGQPVQGAQVLLAQASIPAVVYGAPRAGALSVRTGTDGSFEFPARPDATAVVVRADRGFAQVLTKDLSVSPQIDLTPWGGIDGTVRLGGKPAGGQTVELTRLGGTVDSFNRWRVIHENRTKTDEFGNFTFPKVVPSASGSPGDWMIHFNDPATRLNWYQVVKVSPRQTTFVQIGANGRPVVGRVDGEVGASFTGTLMPQVPGAATRPVGIGASVPGRPTIQFAANPDGSFRVDGVPPGAYRLFLRCTQRPPGSPILEDVALAEAQVTVPELSAGQTSDPVDVGTLQPRLNLMLRAGDAAPDFPALLADGSGKRVRLSDFRGKYVLLYFRYLGEQQNWARPGEFKALFDRFGDDERFAIFDVTIDQDSEGAVKYRAANAIPWTVAAARMRGAGEFPSVYLSSATRLYLIDPEGKVVARSLSAKSAYDAITTALRPRPAGTAGVQVRIDHHPPSEGSALPASDPVDGENVARDANFAIVDGTLSKFSGPIDVLHDGRLADNDNQTGSSLFFEFGSLEGRLRCDLGRPIPIPQIRTYSRHKDTRGPQVYKVYGSDGTAVGFDANPKIGVDPRAHGWKLIAAVDTRLREGLAGGQYAVSLSASSGSLGTYRHLLFEVFPTEISDDWGHTFFSEIEVTAKK